MYACPATASTRGETSLQTRTSPWHTNARTRFGLEKPRTERLVKVAKPSGPVMTTLLSKTTTGSGATGWDAEDERSVWFASSPSRSVRCRIAIAMTGSPEILVAPERGHTTRCQQSDTQKDAEPSQHPT